VVFEDLHWIDSETQVLLDGLVESLPAARMLLLVNYRPEYTHRWGGKTYYTQLRLDPLPPESAEALLDALLGSDPALRPLKHLLIERTEGNPFFLEECVRTLVETNVLAGAHGAYRLAHALPGIQVPATVQAVLAARTDRLAPEEKCLLQAAAVIGKDVPFAVLQAVAEVPEDVLRRGLAALQASEFLHEARLFPDLEYTFKHALTHEVAYGSLLQDRRRALPAGIVEAIEALYAGRLAEHVERLAHHAVRGEIWNKAVTYLRQAGAKAFVRSANQEAVAHFEQALTALTHLPETRETCEQAIDVRLRLRNSLYQLGELEQVITYLREAETFAENLGDTRRLGRVLSSMTHYFWQTGDSDQALAAGRRAQGIAEAVGDLSLQVMTNCYLGMSYHSLGEYSSAIAVLTGNIERLAADRGRERFDKFFAVISRTWLIWSLSEQGRFAEGLAHGQEAARIAESADHPETVTAACLGNGVLYLNRGDLERALTVLERALFVCRSADLRIWFPETTGILGYAYVLHERLAEGLTLLEQALARTTRRARHHPRYLCHLSEGYLLAGRMDEASKFAGHALKRARELKERGHEAWALRGLGEVASHSDPPDTKVGLAWYREGLALATDLGLRPLVAHCHLGLGKLYRRTGDDAKASEHLGAATTLYRELDMGFWLEKAEAAGAVGDS
jgi:tetratricopeptide (TPR) repeat protein